MKRWSSLFLIALISHLPQGGLGQSSPLEALYAAQKEVLVTTPMLEQKELAEGLHYLLTKRGVKVFIVHEYATAKAPAAYTGSLSLVGAQIRFLRGVPSPTRIMVDGKLLIYWSQGALGKAVRVERSTKLLRDFFREFTRAFSRGIPYEYKASVPPGYVALEELPLENLADITLEAARSQAGLTLLLKDLPPPGKIR